MPKEDMEKRSKVVTVAEPLDEDGTCAVHDPRAGDTYRVVDCADPILETKLATREPGETVRVDLAPADPDGLDWIATRLRPGTPAIHGGAR